MSISMENKEEISQYSLKYRPLYFKDVYGQDSVVKDLQRRIKENNYPQAICLAGPFGCGKTSLAQIIAAAMQGHDETGEPLWDTPDGQAVLNQTFDRDVLLLDASRWSKKDDMLEFTQSISSRPLYSASGIRVCIIEEADQASNAAMLSLLKILEAVKPYNKFILCSMEEKGVPAAIKSRCQLYKIKSIGIKDIMMNLKHIMEQTGDWDNLDIPNSFRFDGLKTIATAAQGSMRSAVQFLEQCINSKAWSVEEIDNILNVVDEMATYKILDGVLAKSNDLTMWRKIIWMKTGDETNHFINYALMMLGEAMIYKETGCSAGEDNLWIMKKLSSSPNLEKLFYCLSLHPQLTKPYIRTSDILGALASYYQNVDFRPDKAVIADAFKPGIFTNPCIVNTVQTSSVETKTSEDTIKKSSSESTSLKKEGYIENIPIREKRIVIGAQEKPKILEEVPVRQSKSEIANLEIVF